MQFYFFTIHFSDLFLFFAASIDFKTSTGFWDEEENKTDIQNKWKEMRLKLL